MHFSKASSSIIAGYLVSCVSAGYISADTAAVNDANNIPSNIEFLDSAPVPDVAQVPASTSSAIAVTYSTHVPGNESEDSHSDASPDSDLGALPSSLSPGSGIDPNSSPIELQSSAVLNSTNFHPSVPESASPKDGENVSSVVPTPVTITIPPTLLASSSDAAAAASTQVFSAAAPAESSESANGIAPLLQVSQESGAASNPTPTSSAVFTETICPAGTESVCPFSGETSIPYMSGVTQIPLSGASNLNTKVSAIFGLAVAVGAVLFM